MPAQRPWSSPAAACATMKSSGRPMSAASQWFSPRHATSGTKMKLLVVGSGGREHALAWKLAQSPRVQLVYVAPGNGGTARDERLRNIDITAPAELADFVEQEQIAFTLVGPEAPLAAGIVNLFR